MCDAFSAGFDLILFAGQSNMAGRGSADEAPICQPGTVWEYRAVTAPGALYPLNEPFGKHENIIGLINDNEKKSGSLVSAFAAEYHRLTGRAIVAVSASQGGTSSLEWRDRLVSDAAARIEQAKAWLTSQGYEPANTIVLWCQGETDGDLAVSAESYRNNFTEIWRCLRAAGAGCCGLVQIGHFNRTMAPEDLRDERYAVIRDEQLRIAREIPGVFLAGSFERYEGLMKDAFHYRQQAYNEVGKEAGRALAAYLRGMASAPADCR